MSALGNTEFQAYTGRVERLVERAGALEDAAARTTALDLLQSVMDLHGAAVSRIVELLDATEAGRASLVRLGADPLICGLLVLYGVHPVPLEERLARALENLAPQLRKHSGSAELLGVSEGVVRVKLESSGHGCGNSPDALRTMLERAILEAAPEVVEVAVESAASGVTPAASGFVPLNLIQPAPKLEPALTPKEEKQYEESAA
jgi:Fe-S cluster biogenesis protein NfuA